MSDDECEGGELIFSGNANWSLQGRKEEGSKFDGVNQHELWNFHRLKPLMGVKITKVFSGPVASHCVAISDIGHCYTWGRNEQGQLGHGHDINVYNPTIVKVPNGKTIKGGSCGPNHTLLYSVSGELYSAGAGKCGQLGLGRTWDKMKTFSVVNLPSVVATGCGRDFSMAVDSEGVIYSFGHPEYGCLGNGTDGKTLERAGKYTFDFVKTPTAIDMSRFEGSRIVDVACGAAHTIAMDDQGRLYSWGFGAYGRLGLKNNKDQHQPEPIEIFHEEPPPPNPDLPKFMQRQVPKIRAKKITCGGTSSFAVVGEPFFSLYMWGITKKTGEAFMYPQLSANVSGWRIRSVACGNTSMIVASGRTLITWGSSPTYGELGYGSGEGIAKSSTVSKKVEDLEGAICEQVAAGLSHSLAIVRMDDPKGPKIVEKLPVHDPDEVQDLLRESKPKAAKKKKSKSKKKKEEEEEEEVDDEEEDDDVKDEENEGEDDDEDDDEDGDEDDSEQPRKRSRKQ
eukprot:CAMPEP_0204830374 /NCGR_PEP_ID=MMETSP1346-20131115/8500_1 /ASSEMBLY_ACC=CAM_ASM_000771 /TAXON_ID=215587 /ORGANISM="Aplanochytrium stocchinoi, Strain GSBS06" /LENGTH=507 /DNA_ID=CAMNT_0051960567 /DNA_START=80 /DNA_END=1603 /DNA_ORIENTATION=-